MAERFYPREFPIIEHGFSKDKVHEPLFELAAEACLRL
jgi:hypothetical protein